jgi:hypothetical protein
MTRWIQATLVAAALAGLAAPALAQEFPATDDMARRDGGGTEIGYTGRPVHSGDEVPLERKATRPMDNGTGSGTTWVSDAANPWAGPTGKGDERKSR